MRYGFNNESISLVNRIYDVGINGGPNGLRNAAEAEAFNKANGFFVEYGHHNKALVAAMWIQAQLGTDWNGEWENATDQFPVLEEAWNITLPWGEDNIEKRMTDQQQKAEDVYHDALALGQDFENRLWIATVVVNALMALEGNAMSMWDRLDHVNEEFKRDRSVIDRAILDTLYERPEFSKLVDKYNDLYNVR